MERKIAVICMTVLGFNRFLIDHVEKGFDGRFHMVKDFQDVDGYNFIMVMKSEKGAMNPNYFELLNLCKNRMV